MEYKHFFVLLMISRFCIGAENSEKSQKYVDHLRAIAAQIAKKIPDSYPFTLWPIGVKYQGPATEIQDSITIRWIDPIKRCGVFATKFIANDTQIGTYTGKDTVLARTELQNPTLDYLWYMGLMHVNATLEYPSKLLDAKMSQELFESFPQAYCIDAEKCGNETRFFNHSENPNVRAIKSFKEFPAEQIICSPVKLVYFLRAGSNQFIPIHYTQMQRGPNDTFLITHLNQVYQCEESPDDYAPDKNYVAMGFESIDLTFRASRDINPGDELTISYGKGYWKLRGINPQ